MSARTTSPKKLPDFNFYRIAAIVAEGFSFLTTYLFFAALLPAGPLTVVIAAAVEFMLLIGKIRLLQSRRSDAVSISSIMLDGVLNAGGMWPAIMKLDKTEAWQMLAFTFQFDAKVSPGSGLVISLAAGLLLSVAVVYLWRE